jgi:hypothetical protein
MYQQYERSDSFNGNPRKALEFAAATLTAAGFRIGEKSENSLTATASRRGDWDRCQALLRNVVSIEVQARNGRLTARAELAEYPVLQKFGSMIVGAGVAGAMYYFFTGGARPMPAEFKHIFVIFIIVYLLLSIFSATMAVKWFKKGAGNSVDAFVHHLIVGSGG